MNLTMIFVVLSIFICYMIYDTFKKSKNQNARDNQPASKLKLNYAMECKILKNLHEVKMDSLKYKNISIHFK
jgi:hypothetical protein